MMMKLLMNSMNWNNCPSWCLLYALFMSPTHIHSYRMGSSIVYSSSQMIRMKSSSTGSEPIVRSNSGGIKSTTMFSPRFCVASSRIIPLTSEMFVPVKMISSIPDAEGLSIVNIEVSNEIANAFQYPGQYVKIKLANDPNHKPSYFAMCSSPQTRTIGTQSQQIPTSEGDCKEKEEEQRQIFTFLIKDIPIHHFLLQNEQPSIPLDSRSPIEMALPLGKGFPILDRFDDTIEEVFCFATGSGLAPILSVLQSSILVQQCKQLKNIKVYLGCRTPQHFPCMKLLSSIQDSYASTAVSSDTSAAAVVKVEIIPMISQPEHPLSQDWIGMIGYIQDHIHLQEIQDPTKIGVLLCGQREMMESVKEKLMNAGVHQEKILTNF